MLITDETGDGRVGPERACLRQGPPGGADDCRHRRLGTHPGTSPRRSGAVPIVGQEVLAVPYDIAMAKRVAAGIFWLAAVLVFTSPALTADRDPAFRNAS